MELWIRVVVNFISVWTSTIPPKIGSTYEFCSFNCWRVCILRVKSLIVLLIFDISLSSQAVKLSKVIFVAASFCLCAIVLTNSPGENPPPQGDEGAWRCLPDLCLTFGGVYGLKSVWFDALNCADVILSAINGCLNKVPNITGCCPSTPSKKNPTTTSPPWYCIVAPQPPVVVVFGGSRTCANGRSLSGKSLSLPWYPTIRTRHLSA